MIRVCDISKHRAWPEVTFSEVKVIRDHEADYRFRLFGVVAHVYGLICRLECEK